MRMDGMKVKDLIGREEWHDRPDVYYEEFLNFIDSIEEGNEINLDEVKDGAILRWLERRWEL